MHGEKSTKNRSNMAGEKYAAAETKTTLFGHIQKDLHARVPACRFSRNMFPSEVRVIVYGSDRPSEVKLMNQTSEQPVLIPTCHIPI